MVYISSSCSSENRIADSVKELVQLGFTNIELTGRTEFYKGIENDLLDFKEKHGLNYLIHNYFPPQRNDFVLNIATKNADLRKKTLNLIRKATGLTVKFNQNLYSIHPGFRHDLLPEIKEGFFIKQNNESNIMKDFYLMIDILLKEIVPDGFRIAVENLSPKSATDQYSFLCTPEDIKQFLEYYHNRPNVGIVLDLGHLNVASVYLNFNKNKTLTNLLTNYLDRIFEIHISENNGQTDSHKITSIDSWQIKFLYKNKKVLKDKPIVLEWHHSAARLAYERFEMIMDKLAY